ncbi:uncharacterized protein LOC119288280 [Triticum dicoccoides]|uniref:uncharacterized protein LOC119288280 n=1 Tax=Triticum dicoccoides TaxID=85692 RepID=UPI00188E40B6|nr:uncharacterized protein LOC119288280 [Triticum dicoccoides]
MSWSSSPASAPGSRRAAGRSGDESRSQVRHRENPMCRCNPPRKAPRWISWSRQNPGRRYYCCVDAMHGGCGFVEWHDDPLPKFLSELIGDLRDEVRRLKGAANVARSGDQFAMVASSEDQATREAMVLSPQEQLREKNEEMTGIRAKCHNVVFLFTIFVLGFVAGKMLS